MERLSRDQMLMEHATVAAKRGTCSRLRVGAVFSREGRILATGYNGAPKGQPHCEHYVVGDGDRPEWVDDMMAQEWPEGCHFQPGEFFTRAGDDRRWERDVLHGCPIANHAERNGIDFAARHGISLEGSEVHVTHMPCPTCAGSLLNVGVKRVIYKVPYRIASGVWMLTAAGIRVVDLSSMER